MTHSPNLKQRAKEIFMAALEKETPEQKNQYLDEACDDEPELRREVVELLSSLKQADGFMENKPGADLEQTAMHSTAAMRVGETIGPYKLLEEIGEGGMGSVWVAQQSHPIKRKVALKLIKAGMDSKQVLARFEAERQALAMMDHPNIARVVDAGMTDQGRPYFAMEYVKGVPLTEYCDQAKLSVKARLELFLPICQAVQHAHQKGIIHRDLKPSNILICLYDGKPVPKVIDFGLAKAMHQSLTEQSLYTAHGMMLGTPLYMSPEQAESNNLDIDTRTDVYSLGVILYELLTGSTPLEKAQMKQAAMNEILRLIKEVEPPTPSTRLGGSASLPSLASQRSIDPAHLARNISGDLDWVVMKALEKERSRRYETANGLAEDIRRHLVDEPVSASPPSTKYRMQKFIKRNRAGVVAASAVAIALLLGVIGTSSGMVWALNEKGRADEQAALATASAEAEKAASLIAEANEKKAIAATKEAQRELARAKEIKSLITQMLTSVNPEIARQADTTLLKAILADAAKRLNDGEIQNELVAAELHYVVGETYFWLTEYDAAMEHIPVALEIRKRVLGAEDRETLRTAMRLATVYQSTERIADAESLLVETIKIQKRVLGEGDEDTLKSMTNLGPILAMQGRLADSTKLMQETLEISLRELGEDSMPARVTMLNLACVKSMTGQLDKAELLFKKLVEIHTRVLGQDSPETLNIVLNLASTYQVQNRHNEVLELLKPRLPLFRSVLGKDKEKSTMLLDILAKSYVGANEIDEARSLCQEILESLDSELAGSDASLSSLYSAATVLTYEEIPEVWDPTRALGYAERLCEKAKSLGFTLWLQDYQNVLALAQYQTGDTTAAIESQRRAISLLPPNASERSKFEKRLAEYEAALAASDKESPSEATADDAKADGQK